MRAIATATATALLASACASRPGVALPPGAVPRGPAIGLGPPAGEGERAGLGYAVWLGPRRLISIELGVEFALIDRALDDAGGVARRRTARLGPPEHDAIALAIAPGGGRAFVAVADGTVRELALDGPGAPRERRRFALGAPATAVAVADDGGLFATGSATGVVCLRRLPDGALLQCLAAHRGPISGLDLRAGLLAASSWDGEASVHRLPGLIEVGRWRRPGAANAVALSPDGARLAIARSGAAPRWTTAATRSREPAPSPPLDRGAVVELVTPAGGAPGLLVGHRAAVTTVAWSPDGRRLVSGGWDATVRLWDVGRRRELARVGGFAHIVRAVAISADGRWAAAAAWAPLGGGPVTALWPLLYDEE